MAQNLYTKNFLNPIDMSFEDWSKRLYYLYPNSTVPIFNPNQSWVEWAEYVVQDSRFYNSPLPHKQNYPEERNWIDWALNFVNYISSRST